MDKNETKTLTEALELVKKNSTSKFVGSVNIDVLLNLKDKKEEKWNKLLEFLLCA